MGSLGNRVSLQVRATIVAGQAVTRGEEPVCLGRFERVVLFCILKESLLM